MKLLKKMLLINWHYIAHQLIEFDNINFMTGKNAAGKSTILDALQLVLLGDTRGNFFNKAANDKGGRTLDGYLRGETGDDGDVGYTSIRSGRFTSYIAIEFQDTVSKKQITFGVVFDSYKDAPSDHMFFILNDKIPETHFLDDENIPMDYKKLKSYLARVKAGQSNTYKESNKTYQTELLAKMGAIKPKFFNLFKKAVTFTPIDDIEKFISEYVCDVSNTIDIYRMQENIRQYKELEKQATVIEERTKMLKVIESNYQIYTEEVAKEYMQNFLIKRSNLQIIVDSIENHTKEIIENKNKVEELKKQEQVLNEQIDSESISKGKMEGDLNSSDLYKKQKELEQQIQNFQEKLDEIENKTQRLLLRFRTKAQQWRINIENLLSLKNRMNQTEWEENNYRIAIKLKDNLEYLLTITQEEITDISLESLQEITEEMRQIKEAASGIYYKTSEENIKNQEKEEKLAQEIENLKKGIKPYKNNLLIFKKLLQEKLEEKFKESVRVEILAELLEIKDKKWQDAVECYLNSQMFYIILSPKYYEEAAQIYKELAKENEFYGMGIVDNEKIQKELQPPIQESLAEEITTKNTYAKDYIDYLLGKVKKCEEVTQLRNYKIAITPDRMLYKGFVLRKIFDRNNEFKFIGKKSIEEQIQIKTKQLENILTRKEMVNAILKATISMKEIEGFGQDEIEDIYEKIITIQSKKKLKDEKRELEKELDAIDLSWVETTKAKIKEIEQKMEEKKIIARKKRDEAIRLESMIENKEKSELPRLQQEQVNRQEELSLLYHTKWIEQYGEERFEKEMLTKKVSVIYENFSRQIERTRSQKEIKRNTVIQVRSEYITRYQLSYDITDVNQNAEFSEELERLMQVELPNYIEKIKDSEKKAYEQFREDFLSKLKANIDEVKMQIDELNDALKNSTFGVDSYHFNITPKQEYRRLYDMIMDPMLMEGFNIASESFSTKYAEEINQLFKKLTSSDILDETYEKNIKTYTDYKTYLNFDLAVTDKDGAVQHLSKTLNKKSGGETQTPFYISVLASFAQLYRINKGRNDNTIRLIVFDEAFSKMDEERISESIRLLRKFGFQAIISAPSEKAGDIIPLVDKTLCVIRKNKNTFVTEYTKEQSIYEL